MGARFIPWWHFLIYNVFYFYRPVFWWVYQLCIIASVTTFLYRVYQKKGNPNSNLIFGKTMKKYVKDLMSYERPGYPLSEDILIMASMSNSVLGTRWIVYLAKLDDAMVTEMIPLEMYHLNSGRFPIRESWNVSWVAMQLCIISW